MRNETTVRDDGDAITAASYAQAMLNILDDFDVERKRVEETNLKLEERTAELGRSNAALRATNQATRDFVAIAAHDLRSPLVAVSGFARLLTERWAILSEGERRSMATRIDRNASNLGRFVDDLLMVSTIEGGALRARPETIKLEVAIAECLAAGFAKSRVSVSCIPELAVTVDPQHLRRMLDNYLSNALKYGAPPVRVDANPDGQMIEIRVRDNGPGLSRELVSRLFTKFTRGDTPHVTTQQGSGLGLSIVRGLAEANAGEAYYAPDCAANGGAFILRLPLRGPLQPTGSSR